MGSEQCTSCGATLPSGTRFCPRCGRQADLPLLELERIDRPAAVATHTTVVDAGGGGARRRGFAALAAAAAVLGAVIVLLSGGGGDDAAPVAEPTTTNRRTPRTHLIYPSSTRPGETTTSRPTTTRAPTTTSTTTTVVSHVGVAGSPVLGEPTDGLSLYVASGSEVSRLELDTGLLTKISANRFANSWARIDVRPDRVLFDIGGDYYESSRDLATGVGPSDVVFDGGNGIKGTDLRWSSMYDVEGVQVVQLHQGEVLVAEYQVPSGGSFVRAVGDRVLFAGGGRLYTIDQRGQIRPYAAGNVVSVSERWVLWWGCDDRLECVAHLGDATDPDVRSIFIRHFEALTYGWYVGESVVSPDGRFALLPDSEGLQVLVDLDTGDALVEGMTFGAMVWSPDSRWLFRVDGARQISAVSTVDGRVVQLLPPITGDMNSFPVLGVG